MGWSISPSDGASINSSGVATFTKDGTFTITYTDSNGCTGSTTYTASGCGGGGGKTNVNISLSCSLNSSDTTLTVTANADRNVDTAVSVTVNGNLNLKNSGGITFSTTLSTTLTIAAGSSSDSDSYDADSFADGVSFVDASCSISSLSPTSSSSQDYIKGSGCSCSGGGGTCDCTKANVQVGTTAITLGYTSGATAETTYSHDCDVYINNNEAGGWLDVNATEGKLEFNSITEATATRTTHVYIDDSNGNHCKTIEVTQSGCQYPGSTIQIWLTGLTSSYEYYVLTDEVIGVVCEDWVKKNGRKYSPSYQGLSLGYYQYDGCGLTSYDSGENYYCDIATPGSASCNGSNERLSANTSYHLYGFNGSGFTEVRTVIMPDGPTAQSGADSQKQYKV